jgi:SAM-dependent methyltransferase
MPLRRADVHENSEKLVVDLLRRVGKPGLRVLDVGSLDVNGTYRPLVERFGMTYVGVDAEPGENVDLVGSAYHLPDSLGEFDLVLSGQTLEHLTLPLLAVEEMKRVCRIGGWVLLVAPFFFHEHRFPVDCWRFLPDGLRFLLEGFDDLDAGLVHGDCFGLGRKPAGYTSAWRIERLR